LLHGFGVEAGVEVGVGVGVGVEVQAALGTVPAHVCPGGHSAPIQVQPKASTVHVSIAVVPQHLFPPLAAPPEQVVQGVGVGVLQKQGITDVLQVVVMLIL